jgi:hypothetical protein
MEANMRHPQFLLPVLVAVLLWPSVSLAQSLDQLPEGKVWKDTFLRQNSDGFSVDVTEKMVKEKYQIVFFAHLREPRKIVLSVIDDKAEKLLVSKEVNYQSQTTAEWVVTDCDKLEKGHYYVVITTSNDPPAKIALSLGMVTAEANAKRDEYLITKVAATPREGKEVFKVEFRLSDTALVVLEPFDSRGKIMGRPRRDDKFDKGPHSIDWDAKRDGAVAGKYRLAVTAKSKLNPDVYGKGKVYVLVID